MGARYFFFPYNLIKLIEATGLYPFIHSTQLEIEYILLPSNKLKKVLYRSGKNKIFSELLIDTTCYFFHSFPSRISRGLPNFTDGMDESITSSKCVKDPSRT